MVRSSLVFVCLFGFVACGTSVVTGGDGSGGIVFHGNTGGADGGACGLDPVPIVAAPCSDAMSTCVTDEECTIGEVCNTGAMPWKPYSRCVDSQGCQRGFCSAAPSSSASSSGGDDPLCHDGVKDGNEWMVDCGEGTACGPCSCPTMPCDGLFGCSTYCGANQTMSVFVGQACCKRVSPTESQCGTYVDGDTCT